MSQGNDTERRADAAGSSRLMMATKVAKLYVESGLSQPEIAERLHLSQSRVSRLLKHANEMGIIRTVVVPPRGLFPDVEQSLVDRFGLVDAVVAEAEMEDQASLLRALGAAGATYLQNAVVAGERIGISSWSSTLLALVNSLSPRSSRSSVREVVQVIGGVGRPDVQIEANRLVGTLADMTGAVPRYLPAPGIVGRAETQTALMNDPFLAESINHWQDLSTLLVGIGTLEPSPLLALSGNGVGEDDAMTLRNAGAVGDVCLRFFDVAGNPITTDVDERVIGIRSDELRRVPRRIGVAGGPTKVDAIAGALRGGWVNVVVTDVTTARALLTL